MIDQTKLYIFDKDGTLTIPKSGEIFVQYPEDQQLISGVAERLLELRKEGRCSNSDRLQSRRRSGRA